MNIKEQNELAFLKAVEIARPYLDSMAHQYRKEPKVYKENTKKCKSCKHCHKEVHRAHCDYKGISVDLLGPACSGYQKRK